MKVRPSVKKICDRCKVIRRRGVIRADGEGKLTFDEDLPLIAEDARLVLSEQLRHSILQVMHG